MKYAINLAEDGRILSATYPQYAPESAIVVDTLPDGDISDYLYVNGELVYDPLPSPPTFPVAPRNIVKGEYVTIHGALYLAIENIPNGESIIVG